jgi:hypothetical protein
LPKAFDEQVLGKWEDDQLNQNLKQYAAADAAASLDVFYELRSKIGHKSWYSVIQKHYDHKNIRLDCLDMIADIAPDRIQSILPSYYGRSFGKRFLNRPSVGQMCVHESRRRIREGPALEEEEGILDWIIHSFEFLLSPFMKIMSVAVSLSFVLIVIVYYIYRNLI